MKEFLKILAILVGVLIGGSAVYFSSKRIENPEIYPVRDSLSNGAKTCENVPELPDGALKLATKIIDGDTFLIEGGSSVRILGIDADEKGYPCYDTAKNKLEELILNKEVKLEQGEENLDKYCRYLRYVFLDNQNISLELVKSGLAVSLFFPENIKYREEIAQAEKTAKENKIGCKWSSLGKIAEVQSQKNNFQWKKLTSDLTGLNVISSCQANNYYGKEIIIEGNITNAYRSKTNTVFLNFEKPYPEQCFTAVIFSSDQYKFFEAPEKYYENKIVRIKGVLKEYQDKPEIILKDPSQIEVGN